MPGGIELAAQVVKLIAQGAAVVKALAIDSTRQVPGIELIVGAGPTSVEGLVLHAEVRGPHHVDLRRNADILRHDMRPVATHSAGDGAEARMFAARLRGRIGPGWRFAGEHFNAAVVVGGHGVMDRANEAELVGALGQTWEQLANVKTRHVGVNGTKHAAVRDRGIRLEIKRLQMRRPAAEIEQDDGGVAGLISGGGAGLEQVRQSEAAESQGAEPQKIAAVDRAGTMARREWHESPREIIMAIIPRRRFGGKLIKCLS